MTLEALLNQGIFLIFAVATFIPAYITKKLGKTSLGILSATLAVFAITHGLYHLAESLEMDFLADVIVEPLSAAMLAIFALYFYMKGG